MTPASSEITATTDNSFALILFLALTALGPYPFPMPLLRALIAILVLYCCACGANAADVLPPGTPLRAELFDSIRPQAEKLAGKPVKFSGTMRRAGDWVFFLGELVDKNGGSIPIGEAESSDAMALWKNEDGRWRVVEFHAGFTDVFFVDYPEKYRLPKDLFFPSH